MTLRELALDAHSKGRTSALALGHNGDTDWEPESNAAMTALLDAIEIVDRTLQFYADARHYDTFEQCGSDACLDGGALARMCLARLTPVAASPAQPAPSDSDDLLSNQDLSDPALLA